MMDVSSQMLVYVKVVEMGSISAASRSSGQTPSAVSKQIRHLEDHVGHRLLHRTKAGVAMTDEGREYYEKCRAVADKFLEAEAHISSFNGNPKGVLSVASSVAFGKYQLINALPEFLKLYPEITISLELTDRQVDLEDESFDVAINFSEQLINPNASSARLRHFSRHMARQRHSAIWRISIACGRPTLLAETPGRQKWMVLSTKLLPPEILSAIAQTPFSKPPCPVWASQDYHPTSSPIRSLRAT